jgi:hypothetical protein
LSGGNGLAIAVEQHRPRTGGALVKCKDVLHGWKINRKRCSEKETIRPIGRIQQNYSNFDRPCAMAPPLFRE